MPKIASKNGRSARFPSATKYDAHHKVLSQTYGALADLRRELSDSKGRVAEREEILRLFAGCGDSQRAWLLLEDYFEKLSLTRKDFTSLDWWPRLMGAQGLARMEELAILFLRANRPLPTELSAHANVTRFAEIEQTEQEQRTLQKLEHWLFPPAPAHLDGPRATLRAVCAIQPAADHPALHVLRVRFSLFRPRTGEKVRPLSELVELTTRATHEQELFSPPDWEFIEWLTETYGEDAADKAEALTLSGLDLLQWAARWGRSPRLEWNNEHLQFNGEVLQLTPSLENSGSELAFTHQLTLPGGATQPLAKAKFFHGRPSLALVDHTFYLLNNVPPPEVLEYWAETPSIPVRKLSYRLRTQLRKTRANDGVDWEQLCVTHAARPQFVFELSEDTVRLRLLAVSERNASHWHWTGQEWTPDQLANGTAKNGHGDKPEILEDARLEAAVQWLRRLDWFTPEPGVWIGDANENFLANLAHAWPDKPEQAEYLGNPAFHRLFLSPRQLKPMLVVKGSGIDWFTVSAEWEQEGLKLTPADLHRLQSATGRFVKLPDAGWMELDTKAVHDAHETMADLGVDQLSVVPQKLGLEQGAHLDDAALKKFCDTPEVKALRSRLANFEGIPEIKLPATIKADLRPYQKDGFDFLCHLTEIKLGGILADDMGLGKTLQTLAWIAWLHERNGRNHKPALVICPASVLHNWRREAEKFTPHLKVLVLQSGAARHNLRKQIPQYDIIVTNYALLRRDLEALQKFAFCAVVLDEAQFIKNPAAQVTQSVKQIKAGQRLALTGTPLENRLLDLWSITDFIQPGYLGDQDHFHQTYDVRGEGEEGLNMLSGTSLSAARAVLSDKRDNSDCCGVKRAGD